MLSVRVALSVFLLTYIAGADNPPRQREKLGRGVIAVPEGNGKVLVSWRLTADDAPGIAFNLYRSTEGTEAVKLTDQPLTGATCYEDAAVPAGKPCAWFV